MRSPRTVPPRPKSSSPTGTGTTSDSTQPSKETYLAFDLSAIDPASSITSFSFTLTLDGAAQLKTTPPVLIACSPVRTWSNGEGTTWFDKPTDDCSTAIAATGKPDTAKGTYTFDIPSMAQSWLGGVNTGVAILQDPKKQTTPFQLNFEGPAKVTAKLSYTPPLTATYQPPPPASVPPPVSSGATPAGPVGGVGTSPSLGVPTTTNPTVAAPPPVQVAPSIVPAATVRHIPPAGSVPSVGFWLVAAALLGLLVFVSRVLGDTTAPAAGATVTTRTRTSRLDQVLRARRNSFTLEPR